MCYFIKNKLDYDCFSTVAGRSNGAQLKIVSQRAFSNVEIFPLPFLITAQKMKFFIKDFFSKYDQICKKLPIWSHLLKKCLMENFIFCAVNFTV